MFDNGNLIRTQARDGGVADAFDIPIFTEAYLRPLFARAIGPFRWIALANDRDDIRKIDDYLLEAFPDNRIARQLDRVWRDNMCRSRVCRRASPGSDMASAPHLRSRVNRMVREGTLSGPIAFTRDHLDAGAMAHPNIMTEKMRDGSDAIADWPLLDAMAMCSSQADLVAIHSGGGGYSGYMTSAGVTVIADGTGEAERAPWPGADQRHQPWRDALRRRRLPGGDRGGPRQGHQSLPIVLSRAGAHHGGPAIDRFQVVRWTT